MVQEHNRKLQALGLRVERKERRVEGRRTRQERSIPPRAEEAKVAQSVPAATNDYTPILAQIIEIQHQIQSRRLDLNQAIALIAESVASITRAGGAAIGLLHDGKIRYQATCGLMTPAPGSEISPEKSLSAICLRNGQIVRCEDVDTDSALDVQQCRRRAIQSIVAVPVYQAGSIAGALELYFAGKHAFSEQDVHTGQLMAGLVTEALARSDELTWKESLASERSMVLEALQKLKPDLDRSVGASFRELGAEGLPTKRSTLTFPCRKCGHELVGAEQFCGNCGSPRSGEYEPQSIPGKLAPDSHRQQAQQQDTVTALAHHLVKGQLSARATFDENQPERPLADSIEEELPEALNAHGPRITEVPPSAEFGKPLAGAASQGVADPSLAPSAEASEGDEASSSDSILANPKPASAWTSAASARQFLEQLAPTRPSAAMARFWHSRRGDVYLAVAVILVACVIRWGIWSNHPVSATASPAAAAAHRKPAPDADLSPFDRVLIRLGLAEAPEPPEYKGNPETQVWVDLHTALYYCPGADLYGKTPKGKFTTQRDAQLDQFEPAYQKACN